MDQPREQVAAQLVGAEQEARLAAFQPGWRGQQEVPELLARIVGGDPGGEQRAEHDQQHEQQAAEGALVVREGLPEFLQRGRVDQARVAGGSVVHGVHRLAPQRWWRMRGLARP